MSEPPATYPRVIHPQPIADAMARRPSGGATAFPFGQPDPRACAEAANVLRSILEGSRALLEFQRAMLDLGRDNLRRQQDAIFEAMLRAMTHGLAPEGPMAGPAAFPDFGGINLAAMEAAAMTYRAATDMLSWPPAPQAGRRPAGAA